MTRTHIKTTVYEREHIWLCIAVASLLTMVAFYMYFLSASVVHVVMRKEVDKELVALGSTLSELETEFIEVQHSVSADIASQRGYTVAEHKVFIDRSDATLVLSTQ